MPSSDPRVIETICRKILSLKPKKVLDIGVGFGKWGALTREYTDIWNQRFYQDEWETIIVGVEIHKRYRNPVWNVYSHIFEGDAFDMLDGYGGELLKNFDLTLMVDVLEHIEKTRGLELIGKVMKVTKEFIFSYCNSEQKDVRDNKYEDHISKWSPSDILKAFPQYEIDLLDAGCGWGIIQLTK